MLSDAPVQTLLSLIAPARVILIGPAGETVSVAARWATREPGVTLVRQAQAPLPAADDLLACEHAAALPVLSGAAATPCAALVPAGEQVAAAQRGWASVAVSGDGFALLRPARLASEPLDTGLPVYARARRALSAELHALAGTPQRGGEDGVSVAGVRPPVPGRPTAGAPPRHQGAADQPPVAIVVPIHNAAAALRRCLASLARHTTWPAELWLIDDASTEPEVDRVLAEAAGLDGVRVLRNAVNLGFTATVNRGLRATDGTAGIDEQGLPLGRHQQQRISLAHVDRGYFERPGMVSQRPGIKNKCGGTGEGSD